MSKKPPESANQEEWDAFLAAEGMPSELRMLCTKPGFDLNSVSDDKVDSRANAQSKREAKAQSVATDPAYFDEILELVHDRGEELNARETVVFALIVDGYGRQSISRILGITEWAVRWTIESARERFGLSFRMNRENSPWTNNKTRARYPEKAIMPEGDQCPTKPKLLPS